MECENCGEPFSPEDKEVLCVTCSMLPEVDTHYDPGLNRIRMGSNIGVKMPVNSEGHRCMYDNAYRSPYVYRDKICITCKKMFKPVDCTARCKPCGDAHRAKRKIEIKAMSKVRQLYIPGGAIPDGRYVTKAITGRKFIKAIKGSGSVMVWQGTHRGRKITIYKGEEYYVECAHPKGYYTAALAPGPRAHNGRVNKAPPV